MCDDLSFINTEQKTLKSFKTFFKIFFKMFQFPRLMRKNFIPGYFS